MKRNVAFICLMSIMAMPYLAFAADQNVGTIVELSADAQRTAANDLFKATVFAEGTDTNSATLARQINQTVSNALELATKYPAVKAQTGNSQTSPVYGKTGQTIEGWRIRSEIQLESRNASALAELLGKLQTSMGVSQLLALPSPETEKKAEAEASVAAIDAFRDRAGLVAATLGKKYKIRELNISNSGRGGPVYPMFRAAKAAEAAPVPMQAGDSQVTVTVSGKIELTD